MNHSLAHRFAYHPPRDEDTVLQHEYARDVIGSLALELDVELPEGREKALVMTKLEEALFWANAAIARAGSQGMKSRTDASKEQKACGAWKYSPVGRAAPHGPWEGDRCAAPKSEASLLCEAHEAAALARSQA